MQYQLFDHVQTISKSFKVQLNGYNEKIAPVMIKLDKSLKIYSIKEQLQKQWGFTLNKLRLFNKDGVELFDEDLEFIRDKAKIFASRGEEFDSNINYSEYKILQQLGEGGFGKVLLGQHKKTNEFVAIKIVNTQLIGNAQDIDMVFRESELLKSLDHRNIVKIISCYTLSNMQVVFIMEYLRGGELLEYLDSKGQLTEEEARVFFVQVAEAMLYCHQRKLIHRDLKLENILLANKEQRLVKIVDFGIAGLAVNLNVEKINVGSLRYMAPESLNGASKTIGPQLDVWAMGVILFTLVSGRFPFLGDTAQETIEIIINSEYTFPSRGFSDNLKDLLSRIFIADPNKRIKLKEVLEHDWVRSIRSDDPFVHPQQHIDKYLSLAEIPPKEDKVKKVRLGQVTHLNLSVPSQKQRQTTESKKDGDVVAGAYAEVLRIPLQRKQTVVLKQPNSMKSSNKLFTPQGSHKSLKSTQVSVAHSFTPRASHLQTHLVFNKSPRGSSTHVKTDSENHLTNLPRIVPIPKIQVFNGQQNLSLTQREYKSRSFFSRLPTNKGM